VPVEKPQKADASFLSLNKTEKVVFGLIQAAEILSIVFLGIKFYELIKLKHLLNSKQLPICEQRLTRQGKIMTNWVLNMKPRKKE
jgi:hypothetical protein